GGHDVGPAVRPALGARHDVLDLHLRVTQRAATVQAQAAVAVIQFAPRQHGHQIAREAVRAIAHGDDGIDRHETAIAGIAAAPAAQADLLAAGLPGHLVGEIQPHGLAPVEPFHRQTADIEFQYAWYRLHEVAPSSVCRAIMQDDTTVVTACGALAQVAPGTR